MQVGAMKYQIYIQSHTTTTLDSGQEQDTWTNATDPIFCGINWVNASEGKEGEQKVGKQSGKFIIYNIQTLTAEGNRIQYEDKVYEIESVTPIDNDRFLEIFATVKDNQNVS